MGIRKELAKREKSIQVERKGVIVANVKKDENRWMIIGIYARQNLGKVLQGVESWIKEKENGLNKIMGGDFNARTREMGAGMELDSVEKKEKAENGRRKKNRKIKK